MHETRYNLFVEGECVARDMTLEYAMIFQKAMFDRFYHEEELEISIKRISTETVASDDDPFLKG